MRVQVDDLPRMESTSTSSTARRLATSACLLFHLSRPASAASLSGEFATTKSGIFVGGFLAADLGARRLGARRATRGASPSILRKCGGQGASPRPAASSLAASSSNFSSEPGGAIHACVRIAELREALRNREHGKVGRLAVGNLLPVKWRGHAGVGQRAHGIRRARRPILGVLVVVEEHAVTLLLPPFRTGESRRAPLDCARQRERRAAHLAEGPARFDPHIDVHSA